MKRYKLSTSIQLVYKQWNLEVSGKEFHEIYYVCDNIHEKNCSILRVGYLNEVQLRPWFKKSLDLQITLLVGYFKKKNALLVYFICFHETVHNKWCLHKSDRQTENGLERRFVKHWLKPV